MEFLFSLFRLPAYTSIKFISKAYGSLMEPDYKLLHSMPHCKPYTSASEIQERAPWGRNIERIYRLTDYSCLILNYSLLRYMTDK